MTDTRRRAVFPASPKRERILRRCAVARVANFPAKNYPSADRRIGGKGEAGRGGDRGEKE